MVERSFTEAARAMAATVLAGDPAGRFAGVGIDSRRVTPGALFFALPGAQADGHDFLDQAIAAGAAGVVVHRAVEPRGGVVWLRVEDTFRALHDLTRAVRRTVPAHLVGITGSTGKTTTKELLAAMLARRFRTAKSPGNLNNLYGFPLALMSIEEPCEWMVAELGMSTPGELGRVSELARPDVAVYTNVRPAHLANFGDLAAIAEAKAELLRGVPPSGLVVANAQDPWVMRIASRHPGRVVRYGVDKGDADTALLEVRARDVVLRTGDVGTRFVLAVGEHEEEVELPLHGLYNVENFLAAAATAEALGVPLGEIAAAASGVAGAPMRGEVHRLAGGALLVDDAYNANPAAVSRALESAAALACDGGEAVAVLGDMLELGPGAPDFHRAAGREAAVRGFAVVVGVGPESRETVAAAAAEGARTRQFDDARSAAAWAESSLAPTLRAGDVVLVKGSRGIALEAVSQALRRATGGEA